ncbi:MAG TPA: response regulator [Xanthobacteraceae bacterium]
MGALMRAKDWARHPLGEPRAWPQSLKTVVRIMLTSRYAMWMGWGPDLAFFYNDAYRPTLGVKHPQALGMPAQKVWAEIWKDIGPRIEAVIEKGEATWEQALLLFLERSGYPEETYHTFSYSPLADDAGRVAGMLCVVTEETERVIGERRLTTLRELSSELAGTHRREEVFAAAIRSLGANRRDLPFTLTYLFERDGTQARLAVSTGLEAHPAATIPMLEMGQPDCPWPVARLAASPSPIIITDLPAGFTAAGVWDKPPAQAAIVPIARQGQDKSAGFLVVGLNPYRRFDDSYGGFLNLMAGQIASGIANADAYEDERKRAEALAELDRAKTTFFSNISHEFRTPLTLMLSPLEELLAQPDGADASQSHALVELAHRNALRLLKLVNMLLDFSRLEAGRTQASYQPTDLATFTADLASNFRSAMDGAGLRFVIACQPLDQPVHVDRDMWEKLVLNLLSNAFKFTFKGEIRIELAATGDGAVELTVRDTGVGIPAHELDRVFERFHRVEGQPSRSFEGSGIGLALVQELVKLHGGTIRVESELARGTTFIVRLPFGIGHLPSERIGASPDPAGTTRPQGYVEEAMRWLPDGAVTGAPAPSPAAQPERTIGRVLLVDDNADLRSYVSRLLQERGYEVMVATDGEAALRSARERVPDLILSDVMMPRLDGFGLLRAVRADPQLNAIPLVLLSARAGEEARVEGLDAGADDYLIKPFSARELLARVSTNIAIAHIRNAEQRAMARLNAELEKRVEERTGELAAANRQLLKQIEERERVEATLRQMQRLEAVGQLTSGVAHDFNNLLTVVLGNIGFLEKGLESNAKAVQRLSFMRNAAERGAKLTSQLLAFSRRQRLEPKPINLNMAVQSMRDLLESTMGGSVQIETVLRQDLWAALVDPTQIELVVLNLAINARDAMQVGGRLTVETSNVTLGPAHRPEEPPEGDYVMISVGDTGSGMPPDVVAKCFEPFFTTKDIGKGSGLGLSQVLGFAQQSGGGVRIDTRLGQGTTVKVYLPRATAQYRAQPVDEPATPPTPLNGACGILLVDDDPGVREITASMLQEMGHAVVEAGSGGHALDLLDQNPDIELVLIDFAMPGMNGAELARLMRAKRPDLPMIFLTGYADTTALGDTDEDHIIRKPFRDSDLMTKIRRVLEAE